MSGSPSYADLGAIAAVMALDRAIRCGDDADESVYDSQGPLLIKSVPQEPPP